MSPLTTRNFAHVLFRISWLEGHFPWSFRLMRWGEHLNKGETFFFKYTKNKSDNKKTQEQHQPHQQFPMSSLGKPSTIPTVLKEQFKNTPNPRPTRGFYLDFCRFFGSSGNSTGSWMAWKRSWKIQVNKWLVTVTWFFFRATVSLPYFEIIGIWKFQSLGFENDTSDS